ncbi:MAG TPA: hypothetical protein VF789_10600 [Thermoanaerobaculia bacterium]
MASMRPNRPDLYGVGLRLLHDDLLHAVHVCLGEVRIALICMVGLRPRTAALKSLVTGRDGAVLVWWDGATKGTAMMSRIRSSAHRIALMCMVRLRHAMLSAQMQLSVNKEGPNRLICMVDCDVPTNLLAGSNMEEVRIALICRVGLQQDHRHDDRQEVHPPGSESP